jgi:hypothetical protein
MLRVLETLFRNSTLNIEKVLKSQLRPVEKLRLILDAGLSLIGPRRDEFVVFTAFWAHAMAAGGETRRLFRRLFRRFRSTVKKMIEEGEESGIFREGISNETALLIVGAVEGLGLQYVIDPKAFEPDKSIRLLSDFLENMMKK